MNERIPTYAEFWPHYLREHALASTRWLHFLGTSVAVCPAGTAALTGRVGLLPAALVAGYGFAWVSHFTLEKNRPATFTYPLWSLVSDFRMAGLMLVGRLDKHRRARACATRMISPAVTYSPFPSPCAATTTAATGAEPPVRASRAL
ncbi:Mpo1-like protein [Cystobacter fuscus]